MMMDRYERTLKLHRILSVARRPVSLKRLMDELECSRATVYRDIAFLRDGLGAPIESNAESSAFQYMPMQGETFELPGLWLSSEELHALLALHQLTASSGPDMLGGAIAPLKSRIEKLLARQSDGQRWPIERIRVIAALAREVDQRAFRVVATAVLERHQIKFRYRARSTDTPTLRTVDPQRLTHYRENWYLDAFDPDRKAMRSFSLDRMSEVEALATRAADVPDAELDTHLSAGYGIFSGPAKAWATIRFSPRAARWVADEHWHSKQEGKSLDDGSFELRVPYSNARELLMDIMRYGPDAEVLSPTSLREEAKILLQLAQANYK